MKFDIEKKGYKKSEVDEYIFALKNEYESRLSDQKNRIFQLKSELVDKEKQLSSYKEKTDLIATAITPWQKRTRLKSFPRRGTARK